MREDVEVVQVLAVLTQAEQCYSSASLDRSSSAQLCLSRRVTKRAIYEILCPVAANDPARHTTVVGDRVIPLSKAGQDHFYLVK